MQSAFHKIASKLTAIIYLTYGLPARGFKEKKFNLHPTSPGFRSIAKVNFILTYNQPQSSLPDRLWVYSHTNPPSIPIPLTEKVSHRKFTYINRPSKAFTKCWLWSTSNVPIPLQDRAPALQKFISFSRPCGSKKLWHYTPLNIYPIHRAEQEQCSK
jgi:hypothetical protein